MTTQAELIKIGKRHAQNNPTVQMLVESIEQGQSTAQKQLRSVETMAATLFRTTCFQGDDHLGPESMNLVIEAAKASANLTAVKIALGHLAAVLYALGEPIAY